MGAQADLTLRTGLGRPLSILEVDENFSNINTVLANKLDESSYTAEDILTKIKTVDGLGSGLDADTLDGYSPSSTNTNNSLVLRNSSGNFSAGTITAELNGNVTGNLTGAVIGNVTGNVLGNLTGNVTGNVTGDLTGNVTGNVTGNLTGNVTGNVSGNAGTVTNGVYTTGVGVVTNTMLAGSIANSKLANSSITISGTAVALGGSYTLPTSSTTVSGIVRLATSAEAVALTNTVAALTPATLRNAYQGTNQSLSQNGYQILPGGLVMIWGVAAVTSDGDTAITFHRAFSTACLFVTTDTRNDWSPAVDTSTTSNGSVGASTTGFSFNRNDGHGNTTYVKYFAIGY